MPYNLFLHASIVSQHNASPEQELHRQRRSSLLAISVGGMITLAILTTATAAFFQAGVPLNAGNIANQLQPLLGDSASNVFALGLFAAGLTSAITAPLAAAYAVCGALNWSTDIHSRAFRIVWATVLVVGALAASVGVKPLMVMLFAQATNGLVLPFVAIFLLFAMNSKIRLSDYRNNLWMNLAGGAIVLFSIALGLRKLITIF